ncbi:hypothetical protein Ngar_c17160 [Candidatus Nitrososphaera gargensis Ga9.2]|uniref:Uncharacterized protein n=1 Tax=Nitrososphaera gargensis (strain Ga9.2) TaxID=1237085 RepID=K0IN28_NITGG|nr:hypothetical protein [Candidatus Nitrososphaera gargensis]AFU58649.1 hypothetical protein Ngar_c17160 [Candidatus Nitrososphaera gargensis Ga9.2]
MSKIKFAKHPRSIVRKRQDHPSSLFVTIPVRIVKQWELKGGELVEFEYVKRNEKPVIEIRRVDS